MDPCIRVDYSVHVQITLCNVVKGLYKDDRICDEVKVQLIEELGKAVLREFMSLWMVSKLFAAR